MAKRMLADVLWDAANLHLRSSLFADHHSYCSSYTCDSIRQAAGYENEWRVFAFLQKLGFPKNAAEVYDLFDAFDAGEKRQGVRYMWLLLAMHVAEDEGIEIEVSA